MFSCLDAEGMRGKEINRMVRLQIFFHYLGTERTEFWRQLSGLVEMGIFNFPEARENKLDFCKIFSCFIQLSHIGYTSED